MNRGLRYRLTLAFMIISLVPLLALGIFTYYHTADTIQGIVSRYTGDITNEININLFLNFKNIDDIGKVLLNNASVREILVKGDPAATRDYGADSAKIVSLLKSIKFSNDFITSIFILSARSDNIYAVGDVTGIYGIDFFSEEYRNGYKASDLYRETLTEYNNYKWWPPREVLGRRVFILTRKLYDSDLNVLGVMVIHVHENILANICRRLEHGKSTWLYLMDASGKVIFQPEGAGTLGLANGAFRRGINRGEQGAFVTRAGSKRMFVMYNTFFVTGWKLVALTPYAELIREAAMIRNVTLGIVLICLLAVLALSWWIAKGIIKPVEKLNRLMKQGATGDMSVRFPVRYGDEIGTLGGSFNRMMANIEELMERLDAEKRRKVEAEIRALEAQINPHFLYNTLAAIYWMAMADGNTRVGAMAASLSTFFRLGLNKGRELTTVAKEVEHVRNYLSIQKMRFEERFEYEIQWAEELGPCETIKLILQPLVENSLIHGIEPSGRRGLIRVEVAGRDGRLVFRVSDNGVGIPEAGSRLEELIEGGYGLKNIRERLRLYFNNDFTLNCFSIPGRETVFEVTVPAVTHGEGGGNGATVDCG